MEKAPDAFRTISEVADDLDLPQHVLRFWETRFAQIKPMKRGGGRRYYRPEDVDLLRGIRHLLYGEGYTIRGVQRILKDEGVKFVQTVWRSGAPQPARATGEGDESPDAGTEGLSDSGLPEEESGRGRGFFGILPSLLGGDFEGPAVDRQGGGVGPLAGEVEEPALAPDGGESAADAAGSAEARRAPAVESHLSSDETRALRATLYELDECKRLLDGALSED
ncbi:MAG TPA: MerR family transcriptional regulator [Xanthobacteraceae bacterium]|nr:MerR family transcriptional regulator [Xanthobacteraceae bacterium]